MGTRWRALLIIVVVTLAGAQGATAEEPPDFTGLTMEQLLEVELVSAASRRPQSAREAPSAVTVVSAAEIRHQGYRTLAEVLRAIPSFYVSSDRNYTYVGVRGFGRPGDYNSRVLVTVDGARVNDNVYDSVLVGEEFLLDLDVVEKVEVARGPAASLYGGNAFFAVVNVVTRRGSRLSGGELAAEAGSYGAAGAHASYGRTLASGVDFMASASFFGRQGQDLFFPELADDGGWARDVDGESARRAFASASRGGFSLRVAHAWRRKEVPTGSYGSVLGDPRNRTWDALTVAGLQYERRIGRADVSARAGFGRSRYDGTYVFLPRPGTVYRDYADGDWWSGGLVATGTFGRHTWTAGLEGQWDQRLDQGAHDDAAGVVLDRQISGARGGVFAQDDVRLAQGLRAQVAFRHDVFHERSHTSPRLGLVRSGQWGALKLLYGSAFRAANEYERHYYDGQDAGLRPETIRTLELVAEKSLGRGAVTASVFDNRIHGLITLTGESTALHFENAGHIRSRGFELGGEWRRPAGLRARVSCVFQRTTDVATGSGLTNSPGQVAKADLDLPLASRRAWVGLNAQYVGGRLTLGGGRLPPHALANVTLTLPDAIRGLDLSAAVYNVTGTRYADPGSEEHAQDALPQDGRSVRVKVTWRF
jgi:outer membrane receptor protein involved in Fe transport